MEIHLLENNDRIKESPRYPGHYESGYWSGIKYPDARLLKESKAGIFFHKNRATAAKEGAKSGGRIVDIYTNKTGEFPNTIVFIFENLESAIGKTTENIGWAYDKKIVGLRKS